MRLIELLDAALQEAAEELLQAAQDRAPHHSGALKNSLVVEKNGLGSYSLKATAPHAMAVELGTEKRAAKPFLRPALLAYQARLKEKLRQVFKAGA